MPEGFPSRVTGEAVKVITSCEIPQMLYINRFSEKEEKKQRVVILESENINNALAKKRSGTFCQFQSSV